MTWRTWRAAMQAALYGDAGFYRPASTPPQHFRTAAHTGEMWAVALESLASRVDAELGCPADFTVVDVGAGGGELLAALARTTPSRWRLVGVDVAPRPAGLAERVAWSANLPEAVTGLIVSVELLDVVPLDVVEMTEQGPRLVEVDEDGNERLGDAPDSAALDWLRRWWWPAEVGDRAEVGSTRDERWRSIVSCLDGGLALAVDYRTVPGRDVAGTLTGYRDGRQVAPVPDGSCDLTAHVLFESLPVSGATSVFLTQRAALLELGVNGRRPAYDGDPQDYLGRLAAAGEATELLDPHGLGGFGWLLHCVGVESPIGVVSRPTPPARR